MDLWSINPVTGEFDLVGTGQVSADGSVINTISGGIRNSSWHLFSTVPPEPVLPDDNPANADEACNRCPVSQSVNSEVDFHSGAVTEMHALPTYQVLGTDLGVRLTYDSLRADPRPIVHVGYKNVDPSTFFVPGRTSLVASLQVERCGLRLSGARRTTVNSSFGDGVNYLDDSPNAKFGGRRLASRPRDQPSGKYLYGLASGFVTSTPHPANLWAALSTAASTNCWSSTPSTAPSAAAGECRAAAYRGRTPTARCLLIDGDGSELLFRRPPQGSDLYQLRRATSPK